VWFTWAFDEKSKQKQKKKKKKKKRNTVFAFLRNAIFHP
jgi:hypothetical protein